jgi:hypothetical protein
MEKGAASHGLGNHRFGATALAALGLALAIVVSCLPSVASARPLARDGQIHACYRVKGKPKGAVRIVPSARAHCRRGERRVAWSATGSSGLGSAGAAGGQGQAGANGAPADEAALKAQIGALSSRIEALEGILKGIANSDLTGMLATLQGLDNEQLLSAVNAVPAVQAVCAQSEELTGQVNELGAGVQNLVSVLGGTLLGSIFGGVKIPAALESFSCPS